VGPSEELRVKKAVNSGIVEFRGIRFGIGRAYTEQRVRGYGLRPPR
jgi:hypothetical protein